MKSRSWISVLALTTTTLATALGGQVGCGSEESSKHPGGLLDGGGAGGDAGAGGSTVGTSKALGLACASDADCQDGLMCLSATSGAIDSGSPAHGICTQPCTPGGTTCKAINGTASCVPVSSTEAYCFAGCSAGDPFFGDMKCQQRPDLACAANYDLETLAGPCQSDAQCPTGFLCAGQCVFVSYSCLPQCNGDADCETGQHCDFQSALAFAGLCRPNAPSGLPTGSPCTPNSGADVCRGICTPFSDTVGECTDGCTLGATDTCGWSGTGPADAACEPYFQASGAGDAAICLQLCDCDDDCLNPAMRCHAFAVGSAAATRYGRRGICDLPPPPAGGAGGAGGEPGLPCGTAGSSTGGSSAGGAAGAGG